MNLPGIIPIATGIIAIVTAIITVTIYVTRTRLEGNRQVKTSEEKIKSMESTIKSLNMAVEALTHQLETIQKGKDSAARELEEINKALTEVRKVTGATSDAILIQDVFSPEYLVFLTAHGEVAPKIKKMKVPIKRSLAGTVFKTGKSSNVDDPDDTITRHYRETDRKANFQSINILSLPLVDEATTIGVLQLLNKEGGDKFEEDDHKRAELFSSQLASRVKRLAGDGETLRLLGVVEKPNEQRASIVFSDITGFNSLTRRLATSDLIQFINEYYDRSCTIAMRYDCTIEKYLGDGILLRFNVPLQIDDYSLKAVKAGIGIQEEFFEIKEEWARIGLPVGDLEHRIGISTGPVIAGQIGHPHHLTYAVLGSTVSRASELCDLARHSSSGILVCPETYENVKYILSNVEFCILDNKEGIEAWEVRVVAE